MIKFYLPPLIVAALLAGGLTYSVKKIAEKFRIFDYPSKRKIHPKVTPRLGGVAIVVAFLILVIGYGLASQRLEFSGFHIMFFDKRLVGVLLGALILMGAGIYDDIKDLKPWQKLFWQITAAGIVVAFGLGIDYVRLPAGYHLQLDTWQVPISLFGHGFKFVVWGDLLTMFWIVLMINTLNFLDGLDGLAAGIAFIAGIALFFLSFSLSQFAAALLCVIFAGSVLGFLPWNFNPAKIFMGDSGSMFLGYMLAVISIISGGKLATAFLILGLPLLDVIWVVVRRISTGQSPFRADKLHLHHRLLAVGLTQRQTVLMLYLIAAFFGAVSVFSGTQEKIQALYWLLILMGSLAIVLIVLEWKKRRQEMRNNE